MGIKVNVGAVKMAGILNLSETGLGFLPLPSGSDYLSICRFICQSVSLLISLSIYLSVCLFLSIHFIFEHRQSAQEVLPSMSLSLNLSLSLSLPRSRCSFHPPTLYQTSPYLCTSSAPFFAPPSSSFPHLLFRPIDSRFARFVSNPSRSRSEPPRTGLAALHRCFTIRTTHAPLFM